MELEEKTILELREEIRRELEAEQRYEAEQRKLNSNSFKKVMKDFEGYFQKFNWERHFTTASGSSSGKIFTNTVKHYEAYKVKSAISTLARCAFFAESTAKIPSSREEDLRNMTQKLLDVVFSYREPNKN